MEDWLEIGTVVSAQGLKGEVRVYPDSDFPERFEIPGQRWLWHKGAEQPEARELVHGRYLSGKGLYVLKFADVNTREQAEAMKGYRLVVSQADRLPLAAGEFHLHDLIGLAVFQQVSQEQVGTVIGVATAGNDLLEVQLSPAQSKVFIPLVREIVPTVDLANGRIEITPPAGLLPESSQSVVSEPAKAEDA
ncbi:MAG: ribosome maturation factor RimM [Aphanocapsa sp. GSE-SYN-MK-11-07L]|nr:ribosome maturation factor RimM [Aphanocapsa sp. GSE-SYN-MK-11-07L]